MPCYNNYYCYCFSHIVVIYQTSPNHFEPTDPNVIQRCLDVSDEGTTPDSGSDTRFTGYFIIEHEDFSAN